MTSPTASRNCRSPCWATSVSTAIWKSTRREPETSLETGLPVFNVVRVRAQPGGAGTVVNNLAALGIGQIIPLGFAGDDGEGFELVRALEAAARRAD